MCADVARDKNMYRKKGAFSRWCKVDSSGIKRMLYSSGIRIRTRDGRRMLALLK